MTSIQNKAIDLYNKNLSFLKQHDYNLYQRIVSFSDLINQNQYQERYVLEYLKDDINFDIYDTANNTYLYERKTSEFISNALEITTFDKKSSIDLLHPITYNVKQPYEINDTIALSIKEQLITSNDIFDYIKLFKKSTVYKNKQFKYIEKFIFAGTLLGSHILPIHEKIKSSLYFIYEYNLEIFRLSLFVTDYQKISKDSNIIFSIMDEKEILEHKLSRYFNYAVRANYMAKYFCTNYNINDFFDRLITVSSHRSPLAYSYSKILEGLIKPLFKNAKDYPVLNTLKQHKFLKDVPILMVAAGPSLENNINWLFENKDNFFIVSIGAAVSKLIKHDIIPDIIVSIDADEITAKQFPDDALDTIKDIPLIASLITHKNVLNKFNKQTTFLFEVIGCFKDISSSVHGYSVGEMTLNICSVLGSENIYLLGTDLALDPETGASHTSEHQHTKNFDISEENQEHNAFMKSNTYNLAKSTILTKGNLREKLLTNLTMEKSITSYIRTIKLLKNKNININIYNLCDGAFIEGTIPFKITDLRLADKTNIPNHNKTVKFLNNNSELGFSQKESASIENNKNSVKELISILDNFSDLITESYDEFLQQQSIIVDYIYKQFRDKFARYSTDRIFLNYILTVEPYLGYQLNEKDIEESEYIDDIKTTWITHMKRLANEYISIINDGLKK